MKLVSFNINGLRARPHQLAELIGADVINLHAGGVYGDKPAALRRLSANLAYLPAAARSRLTLRLDNVADRRHIASVIVNEANGRFFEPGPGRRLSLQLEQRWGS